MTAKALPVELRRQFLIPKDEIYLNNGTIKNCMVAGIAAWHDER
jgi:hypothetical protein